MSATERALLLVPHPAVLLQRAGGLTVLERQLWTLARAGFKQAWVGAQKPDPKLGLRMPPGLEIHWADSSLVAESICEPPYVAVSGDHFVRVETLRYVAEARYPVAVALEDETGTTVLQAIPSRNDRAVGMPSQPLPPGASVRLQGHVNEGRAPAWLLSLGNKPQDGFMARNFDRRLSQAFSRLLLDTPVSPNMMTIASSLIGLAGAACFLNPAHGWRLGGALLVWLHSVLDGCDGELARIRFQESDLGADIDFWGDNLVHLSLFFCIAWGFYRADQDAWPLIAAGLASVGTLGSAVMNFRERLARRRGAVVVESDPVVSTLSKIENALAARDFIYLLVLCAYLDRLYEFMWAAAVGSLLFFFMSIYLGGKKREQAYKSDPAREGQAGSPAPGDGSGHQHVHSGR